MTQSQQFAENVSNQLEVDGHYPELDSAEHAFALWAFANICDVRRAAIEVVKCRRGGKCHDVLSFAKQVQAASDEPLPFLV